MPKPKKESLASIADARVPFSLAASWAGIYGGIEPGERGSVTWCPAGVLHADQGKERAFRVYPDHGYCFAEKRYFGVVALLALAWEMPREDAAREALKKYGYVPADYAHLWENVLQEPEPDREALAAALREFCRGRCPDWASRQYDPAVSGRLAACLALLPSVKTAGDCELWRDACWKAMTPFLS